MKITKNANKVRLTGSKAEIAAYIAKNPKLAAAFKKASAKKEAQLKVDPKSDAQVPAFMKAVRDLYQQNFGTPMSDEMQEQFATAVRSNVNKPLNRPQNDATQPQGDYVDQLDQEQADGNAHNYTDPNADGDYTALPEPADEGSIHNPSSLGDVADPNTPSPAHDDLHDNGYPDGPSHGELRQRKSPPDFDETEARYHQLSKKYPDKPSWATDPDTVANTKGKLNRLANKQTTVDRLYDLLKNGAK